MRDATSSVTSIQIAVSSLGTTEAFYAGILEVPVRRALTPFGAMGYLVMEREGWRLVFVEEEGVVRAHPFLAERFQGNDKGVGLSLHFQVKNIEAVYEAVMEEDLEIVYPLSTHPYGVKEFWCLDPDGYLVVLEEEL